LQPTGRFRRQSLRFAFGEKF